MILVWIYAMREWGAGSMREKFNKIVDDGTGPVALFESEGREGKHVFAMRRDLLRARLSTRQLRGLETGEEERALEALDRALEEAAPHRGM
jgi:hypothetical protein